MLKIFLLLLVSNKIASMEYVSLADNKVYDVEIILFAYDTPLPNAENYINNNTIDLKAALILEQKPEDLAFIKSIEMPDSTELTLPIDGETNNLEVLSWFVHDESAYKLNELWDKLEKNPNTKPLLHKSWRQASTPFNNPVYVNLIDTVLSTQHEQDNLDQPHEVVMDTNSDNEDDTVDLIDYLLNGKVALSEGRYLHFGHNLNLQRTYLNLDETRLMNFSLTERKQIKPDQLHYFDNPWFGSIVKVTSYTGEEENEASIE